MSKPSYRVLLSFDGERKTFVARAPELEHCSGEGATRAEAIARVEEEITAQVANMLAHGTNPPAAVDEEVFSGELAVKVSKGLHRDLAWQARSEGVELDHLVGELLVAAIEGRKGGRTTPRGNAATGNRQPVEHIPHDGIGNTIGNDRGGGGGGGGARPRTYGQQRYNSGLLDDRANFIEYVRGLEGGGGPNHGSTPNRGPGGGGGGGGGGGSGAGGPSGGPNGPGGRGRRRRGRGSDRNDNPRMDGRSDGRGEHRPDHRNDRGPVHASPNNGAPQNGAPQNGAPASAPPVGGGNSPGGGSNGNPGNG